MSKKRFRIKDSQGNVVPYDINSADVTLDDEGGKSLDTKLAELEEEVEHASDNTVSQVTFNGTPHTPDGNGNVNIGQQMQADWSESNSNYPSYIKNKPTIPEGATVDQSMSDTSENAVQNKVIKAYVDAVSQRIDTLIGSGNVQGAIDTFNEVVAFLNGINSSDTLAAKLLLKADKTYVDGQLANKQNTIIADNGIIIAQDGKTVSVAESIRTGAAAGATAYQKPASGIPASDIESGVIPTLPQNIVQSVTINGNTVTPNQQTGNVDLGSVQGQKGDKGDKGDTGSVVVTDGVAQIAIRNDLTTGGTGDALSAEMGKYLKTLLDSYESRMDALEESGAILMSMSGKTLVISRITDPIVLAGDLTRTELNAVAGGSSIPSVFFISGRNLAGNIGIALSDSTNFTLSTSSLTPVDGKVATTMVSVTYTPASGAAADTTHNCNVVITYDGTTKKTMSLSGTVAASASVSLTPSSLTLKAIENGQTSGTIRVEALALSGDVTLELSGSGLSFADDESVTTKTIARADAEDGIDVTIYYTAGSSDVTGTLTASSTGVTSVTATINGVVAVPLAVGSYWLVNNPQGGKLKYVVTSATNMRVSVEGSGNVVSSAANPLIIPASVNDSEATVYDSGGNVVASSGLDYAVTSVAASAFQNTKGSNLHTVVLPEGLTTIGDKAFQMTGDYGNWHIIKKVVFPSTLKSIGQHAFNNTGITEFDVSNTTGLSIANYALYGCRDINKFKLNGGSFGGQVLGNCPQLNGTGTNPVVVSYAQTAPSYAAQFMQSGASTVTATLYCPDVSAYNAAGWNIFTSVQDINDYTE